MYTSFNVSVVTLTSSDLSTVDMSEDCVLGESVLTLYFTSHSGFPPDWKVRENFVNQIDQRKTQNIWVSPKSQGKSQFFF